MAEFWNWWQHLPQHISPVIFQIGSFKLQYYGLMYIVAFAITYGLVIYRLKHESRFHVSRQQVNDLTTVIILGLMIGARLGYVVFYNFSYFLKHPFEIFLPFEFSNGITFTGISGMSYHGGVIGILVAAWLYTRKNAIGLRDMADLYVPSIPLGYTFGRLGNFINGELYGRVTAAPIGMYFPLSPEKALRHPSQLYEAFLRGDLSICRDVEHPQGEGSQGRHAGFLPDRVRFDSIFHRVLPGAGRSHRLCRGLLHDRPDALRNHDRRRRCAFFLFPVDGTSHGMTAGIINSLKIEFTNLVLIRHAGDP